MHRAFRLPAAALVFVVYWVSGDLADAGRTRAEAAKPWASVKGPAPGKAESIGSYGNGCLRGGKALPLKGLGYQVARPWRRRHFAHPQLIAVIERLGKKLAAGAEGLLLVADLGQPRGGPAPSGHASHQSGLDADIWFWTPQKATSHLTNSALRKLQPRPVVAHGRPTPAWSARVGKLLRWAASDQRVARIFVNPHIKRQLCQSVSGERGWLGKLRVWWGHDAHFHIRLSCPVGSPDCKDQEKLPAGDGCDQVAHWLSAASAKARQSTLSRYRQRLEGWPELPTRCAGLLAGPARLPPQKAEK
ncbi:MAG: penicillin-insensitive murein endopeptidase [Deltaproteobacteria bacterium]|nr:penicillin-insensitive murein endopeptidase [Deltaproteobacteria bacterium]